MDAIMYTDHTWANVEAKITSSAFFADLVCITMHYSVLYEE